MDYLQWLLQVVFKILVGSMSWDLHSSW